MAEYIFLIKGGSPDKEHEAEFKEKWKRWWEKAKNEGKYVSGHPFEVEGKLVCPPDQGISDCKDDSGGYIIMEHPDVNEAVDWASRMPNIEFGGKVSVHKIQRA